MNLSLDYMMPNVYRLLLNITIQHVSHCFNHGLCSTFFEFEWDIEEIFDEINAYIPQFTTKSDTPPNVNNVEYLGPLSRSCLVWQQPIGYIKTIPSGKMCNVLCHTSFPIKDTINKTYCPIKGIYYHWQRLL